MCAACGRRYESVMSAHCWGLTGTDVMRVLSFHTARAHGAGSGYGESTGPAVAIAVSCADVRQAASTLKVAPTRGPSNTACSTGVIPDPTGGTPEVNTGVWL